MNRRGRASQVVDLIDFEKYRLDHIVSNELEPGVPKMVDQVLFPPGEEIVNHNHIITSLDKLIDKVTTNKPGPTGDHDPRSPPRDPSWDPPKLGRNGGKSSRDPVDSRDCARDCRSGLGWAESRERGLENEKRRANKNSD